ncbi:MAG TPA: amino acid adenylation domain-containing protein, partial [Pyrinomonadaceae bacterium]
MSRKNVEDLYPLSPLQQGLFFHTLYAPTSGVYVEQLSCTLRGALDVEAFKQAWQQVVDRHPVLRTAFVWKELAEPIQVVRQRVKLPCVEEDWRGQSPVEQQEHLQAYLKADRERGFDLSKAPPLRVALFRLSDDSFHFLWSYHHLVLDGWCTPLVLREVFAFYEAFSQRRDISLERSRPYRDYIAWLRKQDLSKAEAFWRETLKGFSAPTPLSVDKTPERQTGDSEPQEEYREQQISLTTETTSALQSLARGQQLTLNTLMQGAWALLLSRYSGERDVVFGVTVSGRPAELAGVETMVGLFINTLPVRVKIDDRESLSAWLKQLQERQVELRQFEYSPLVQVQGWSEVARGVPLFESLLVFENYPVDASFKQQLAQLSIDNVHKIERTNYPLTLLAVPGTELLLHISYDRRRFSDATIKRMLGHLSTLLEGMVANPTQRLSSLPLLTQTERHQLLVEWNDTATAYPPDISLHELFQQQVARTPDHIAVRFEDEQLSYAELNTRANQLAHRLRAAGVGVETRVGVCVERSIEMVVALLGILKAGGAYVPLDASYPPERLTFMHRDAQVKLLLTQQRLLEALPARDAEVICLDRDWDGISGHDTENPRVAVSPQNAAYVIYTSGTTGQPKGVLNTHAGICNRLLWMQDAYALASDDRVLQKTPLSFDVSVWEVFWPLITGARLVVARAGGHQDAAYQREVIGKERITTLHFVPSMLQAFVSEPEVEGCRSLRQVMSSGEALSKELQERFFARLPNTALHNLYGPTEAAVDVTHWTCERETARLSVPIGRPIANTQLYILNDAWQPVPVGIAGELYIGGAGLARGYLHRPALTAEKFVPNPFAADAGRRLYRTGDKARYAEDGTIEFLGRLDHQVKLRGFRIELGEIETALLQHPSIRECVVVLREGANGDDKRIVAYTVAESGEAASHGSLRSFLKEKLPEYMLPSVFVALDALPLTPSGKIDRRALPVPARTHTTTDGSDAATTTGNPLEEVVAGVWAEVLGVETVGAHDNFFELGGHSLLALQVISRLRTVLKVEMPVRELFEAPTVRGFTERIEKQQRAALGLPSPPLERTARDGELPLSFAQQRLWFLDQLEPHSPAYNIPSAIRLTGELDLKALEESFNEVVRRHEVLRTSFAVVDRQAVQRIQPRLRLPLRLEDLRHLPVEQREASIESIAAEDASRAFDLKQAPLLRLRVLRVDDDVHVVLLVMHHIISDGWSLGVLIREVAALYESFSQNEPSPLAELSIQYGDFAQWQRAWLKDEALETQLQYWRQQLDGSLARLPLPTLQEQSATSEPRAFRGAKQQVALPLKLSEALKQLSRREGATLFMTLLAAFQTLLYRYTGEHDITVGSPVANRQHEEIEGLIGFFVNTLALRTDLSGNPSFAELLKRVREVCLGAYAHQDVPFEKLVEELQPQRSLHHSPLFQVMFVLQNAPLPSLELRGLKLAPLPIEKSDSKFDLTLSLEETRDGLKGVLEYDTDIFDAAAIRRLCGHFETLLEGVVANPTQRLSELPLLTVDERHELLVEWNDTRHDYPQESCFQQLFEKQVERTPDALAVSFVEADGRESNLTYRELNARANQLAHYLRRLGVRAETLVGILFERSPEMLVSVLGVYKAGGAYLPLDPAYPSERLSYMLADARVRVLLTRGRHAERLPTESVKVVYLDEASAEIEKESRENPPCVVAPENLAYVIYTSGSTGRPKGVMTSHRGLANLSRAEALAFGLKAETRVLQVASWSFDASVFEMVMTLMAGATLYLAPTETLLPGEAFTQFLQEHSINAIALTPTTLAAVPPAALPALQTVITGGEPCPAELVARWVQGHRFFNVYGPTETTTWATFSVCRADGRKPAIGRPVANTQVYILDDDLQPVPVGINGQIHIGGVALARGYLNQPRLTAEKFIPHPFSDEPGARLYRTGDIARRTTSGEIEFVGRTDQQVKLRGFRIELGEIEAALGAHAAVEECAVIMREDAPGERRIVAYVVLEGHANAPTIGEWRDYLKEKLPDYMLPAAFVVLETWPLTPNGKLNRRALPAPEQSSSTSDATTVAARTPNEKALADIWCEVLKREVVGIYDNFFELGGHSLLATQIVSRVCERFDVELPLRSLFEAPTVAGLTERVEAALGAVHERHLPAISPVDRNSELPLSFAQQRLWFLDQLEPGNPFYNIPSAVRLVGALNVAAFRRCVNEVIRRHEILRTTFHSTQGQPQQVISPASDLPLDVENLRALPEPERRAEVQRLAFEEANHPFDLAQGPLVRARLLQTAEQEHVLLVTMHHIVSDGWSFTILFREIGQLYEAYARGENTPLAPLTIQYADYAAWQRHWLTDERLEAELAYWKEQLKDAPPLLELPTDRPRPAVQSYRGASVELLISKELTEEIREMSQEQGATLFMTLLAAFQVLLARYSNMTDIVVGTPVANRTRSEVEGVIGFFVNTLVMRVEVGEEATFEEVLGRVREASVGGYGHQEVPFEKLVEEIAPERRMSQTPIFQVMFALQHA